MCFLVCQSHAYDIYLYVTFSTTMFKSANVYKMLYNAPLRQVGETKGYGNTAFFS